MKVKAKTTIAGSYGRMDEGQEKNLEAGLANELHKAGLVEIVDENASPEEPVKGKDMTGVKGGKKK